MVALAKMPLHAANDTGSNVIPFSAHSVRLDHRAFSSIATREEAEYLLMLDHTKGSEGSEWTAFFVESMVGFLVWQTQPWGMVSESDIDWMLGLVADAPSPSVPALLFALVREMNDAPERLVALAMKHPKGRVQG